MSFYATLPSILNKKKIVFIVSSSFSKSPFTNSLGLLTNTDNVFVVVKKLCGGNKTWSTKCAK